MESASFLVVALFVVGYGLVSARVERAPLSAPLVFVAFGLLIGGDGLGVLDLDVDDEVVRVVIELTLVVVLFTDASRIDLRALRRGFTVPLRMLAVGLPLTIVAGALVALALLGEFSLWEAVVLAVVLAPTDAALGQAVVSSPEVPARIRQTLNVESGLNDGIVLAPLTIALALAAASGDVGSAAFWTRFALQQVLVAVAVGAVAGYLGGRAVEAATRAQWMTPTFERLSALGISIAAFALAVAFDGSGFIAAFVAGIVLGNAARPICGHLHQFAETEGQLLTLLVFLFFGEALVWPAVRDAGWETWLYAVLSLTVVRMVPVAISLVGLKLRPYSIAFLGWFGPRGLASIVFGLVVLAEPGFEVQEEVFAIVVVTVLLSIVAHGVSASPAAKLYSRGVARAAAADPDMAEMGEAPDMPLRRAMPG